PWSAFDALPIRLPWAIPARLHRGGRSAGLRGSWRTINALLSAIPSLTWCDKPAMPVWHESGFSCGGQRHKSVRWRGGDALGLPVTRGMQGETMDAENKPAGKVGSDSFLDRYFGLTEHGTSVRTEAVAGLTTFLTMVY